MSNKNFIGFITAIFLMIISVLIPTSAAEPSIMITNYEVYPSELMPGDIGLLTLNIQNTETLSTTTEQYGDVTDSITIVETNGVVISRIWLNSDEDDNGKKVKSTIGLNGYNDFGNIAPGSIFQVSFEIIAEENISEGNYFPELKIDLKKSSYEDVTFPIKIRVSNESVDLLPKNVPSKISIGGSTDISFSIVNKRNNNIDSITISPNYNDDLNFNPKSMFIGSLEAGKSEDIIFSINPNDTGQKFISLNLSFKNGDNQHFQNYDFPIEVIEILDVAPILTDMPITITKGKSARIGLEVYNAKIEPITGVIITPISDAKVIPSQYFIGAMDPDDVFSASFDIFTNQLDYGNHTINFKVSFKQGSEYYETPSVSHIFKIVSGAGTSYKSNINSNSESTDSYGGIFGTCMIIIPIIIVIVIVYIFWRWKKGRKK